MTLLKENDILKKKWKIGHLIGKGNFGEVYSVENKSVDYELCVKVAKASKNKSEKRAYDMIYYEYTLLNCRLYDFPYRPRTPKDFYGEDLNVRFLVMERLDIALSDIHLKNNQIYKYGIDIIKGIEWLHTSKWIKNPKCKEPGMLCIDIKPDNFMIDYDGNLKFVDFGLMQLNTTLLQNRPEPVVPEGTANYMSLDVQDGKNPSYKDDIESVIYVLIFMRKKKLPWFKPSKEPLTFDELISKKKKYVLNGKLEKFCRKKGLEGLWEALEYVLGLTSKDKINYYLIETIFQKSII